MALQSSPLRPLLLCLASGMVLTTPARADFIADGKATLGLRNFYFNRDYRQPGGSSGKSKMAEWAQGFILKYESGFTEGPVGIGLDAIGMYGLKLDSGRGDSGSGLLPVHNDGDVPDDYGKFGLTLKMRYAASEFRYGTLIPNLPIVSASDLRLLPQTFRGAQLESRDIDNLTLRLGRLTRNVRRDSSSSENMSMVSKGVSGQTSTDQFDFAGIEYQWTPDLNTGYHYANLDNNYHQHYFTLRHRQVLGARETFSSDLRFARSSDDGNTNVDNRALGAMFSYQLRGHKMSAAWQKMTGDTGFAYLSGSNPYLVNFVQMNDFAKADEKSWQLRYDYDFADVGIPGLTLMTRYIKGWGFDQTGGGHGEEWERDTDIAYTLQSGPLKGLGMKWRNAVLRSNGAGSDLDGNRLIFNYSLSLL